VKVILNETNKDFLFKNKEFHAKYLEFIKYKIDAVQVQLNNPGDLASHLEYMNLLINYSLYRKLFTNFGSDDKKIYKKIWALQKQCPIIILYNNLTLNAGNFLVNVCPVKKATVEPKDINAFLKEQVALKEKSFSFTMQQHYLRLVKWVVEMNSDALKDSIQQRADFLRQRSQLI